MHKSCHVEVSDVLSGLPGRFGCCIALGAEGDVGPLGWFRFDCPKSQAYHFQELILALVLFVANPSGA